MLLCRFFAFAPVAISAQASAARYWYRSRGCSRARSDL